MHHVAASMRPSWKGVRQKGFSAGRTVGQGKLAQLLVAILSVPSAQSLSSAELVYCIE